MLDIKFIRENKELIKQAAERKKIKFNIDTLFDVDEKRREKIGVVENLRNKQKQFSDRIAITKENVERKFLIDEVKPLKDELQIKEKELSEIMKEWQKLMIEVPNIPDVSVPEGEDESQNVEIKNWGTHRVFDFTVKDHIKLMTDLKMVDFERGAKTHGFRGYFLINNGAKLNWAIWNYARDFFSGENTTEIITPTIVRKEFFYGTGHLPNEAEDLYVTQDGDCLTGTAEVPMMAYHSNEILLKSELPKRYLAFSPCFRREAGSYGKDIKGLIRVHEFYKFEQLILCEASHAESEKLHEEITEKTEKFIESLGLSYRRTVVCTGDLSASKVKQYEVELWIPSQGDYREIGSASYYHDYQTRRFNIRYDDSGVKRYVHSLNNTAIPTPRVLVSLVENYQRPDGKIDIPDVLKPYMGGKDLID